MDDTTYSYVTWFRYHGDTLVNGDPFRELREHGSLYLRSLGVVHHVPLSEPNSIAFILNVENAKDEIQFAQDFRMVVREDVILPENTSWLSPIRIDKNHSRWLNKRQQSLFDGIRDSYSHLVSNPTQDGNPK